VAFEGLMTDGPKATLSLLDGFDNDDSNVFSMSKGFVKRVGHMNGYQVAAESQAHRHRGAVLFKAGKPCLPRYPAHCYPVPPNAY